VEPPSAPAASQAAQGVTVVEQLRTQAIQLADHLMSRQADLDRREAELNARVAELETGLRSARLWFTEREAEIDERRERWLDERRQARQEIEAARQQLDQERRRQRADLQEKRLAVQRRAEQVDRAWVILQQAHEEIGRIHRETLELRLANEELRAELTSVLPPEEVQRALKGIRAKLSEEYRRAGEALARQKEELLAVRRSLAEQYANLAAHRDEIERLASRNAGSAALAVTPPFDASGDRGTHPIRRAADCRS
jgi:chromosome segregation ATPase